MATVVSQASGRTASPGRRARQRNQVFLDHVLGVGHRAQHAVGQAYQPGPLALEQVVGRLRGLVGRDGGHAAVRAGPGWIPGGRERARGGRAPSGTVPSEAKAFSPSSCR